MNERRPLTTAITSASEGIDAETARSFVKQQINPEVSISSHASNHDKSDVPLRSDFANSADTKASSQRAKSKKASRFQRVGLIPVTIRLRPEIAVGLKRASLELELEGEDVFTQQDLVENALEPWLRENGFLS